MEEVITVSPSQFDVPFEPNKTFRLSLNLSNKTDGDVAFKVKTTAPTRYMVRPSQGYVDGGGSSVVEIVLTAMEAFPDKYKDKFLVQSCPVDERVEDISGMWKAKESQHKQTKDQYHEHRLKCKISQPAAERAAAADAKGAAEAARLEVDEPGGGGPQAMVTARGSASPRGSTTDTAELAKLRQMKEDYERLVQHTATLESKHRKLEKERNDLDRKLSNVKVEKEAAEKKAMAAEQSAEQARSDLEEAKSNGLRHRAAVPGEGEPDVTDDKDEPSDGGVTLPLWQLVALVVIFYMLGYFS